VGASARARRRSRSSVKQNFFTIIRMPRFDILSKLEASKALTPEGSDWLKLALDPFHDFNHQIAGYPDTDGSQTVVSCYQYQLDVTVPAGVAGNWDAHVFTMPIMHTSTTSSVTTNAAWTQADVTAATIVGAMGPLNIYSGAAGNTLQPEPLAPATNVYAALPAALNYDLSGGISRVLGVGFEVTNTTAEISKQGSVTVYRMPQSVAPGVIGVANAAGTSIGALYNSRCRMPPQNLAQANLLKGTRTWDAASGVYVVGAQNSLVNELAQITNVAGFVQADAAPGAASRGYVTPYTQNAASAAVAALTPSPQQFSPFDTSGAYFTGLSPATILTVKYKVYVERAPTFAEPQLAVLASPSASYDGAALTLYSRCVSELPVATKVFDNASGDWWRDCLSVLASVAGPVGMAMNSIIPGAGGLGMALQSAASLAKTALPAPRPKTGPQRSRQIAEGSLAAKGKRGVDKKQRKKST